MTKFIALQTLSIIAILSLMNFSGLLDAVKNSFLSSPSVVGNVAQGRQWNQDLPRFGGVAPQNQMVQNPNIASPLQAPDEMTPGMIHGQKLNDINEIQAHAQVPVQGVEVPDTGGQPVIPQPTPTPSPTSFDSLLEHFVFPWTRGKHIPDSVAAGQTGIESAYGKSPAAVNQNNLHGIMQWDEQGNRSLRSFDSASDSAKMYANTINNILSKKGYDITKMTPEGILTALQTGTPRYEGDNSNPQEYVDKVKGLSTYRKYSK